MPKGRPKSKQSKVSLLDKAKTVYIKRKSFKTFSREEVELVEAWLDNEIALHQLQKAMNMPSPNNSYSFIAFVCRQMWQSKRK